MKGLARAFVLACLALAIATCDQTPDGNPASLWLTNSQSELNLILIDHEPPPF